MYPELTLDELREQLSLDEVTTDRAGTMRQFELLVIKAERRRILDASLFQFGMGDGTYMMIRTSVVDPKETDNGK